MKNDEVKIDRVDDIKENHLIVEFQDRKPTTKELKKYRLLYQCPMDTLDSILKSFSNSITGIEYQTIELPQKAADIFINYTEKGFSIHVDNYRDLNQCLAKTDEAQVALDQINTVLDKKNRLLFLIGLIIVDYYYYYIAGFNETNKPLEYRDITEDLEISEAFLTLLIQDKSISTPRGLIKLEDFFEKSC